MIRTEPVDRNTLAELVAEDIEAGSFVNLEIGQPTLVSNYLTAEHDVTLHTENGMIVMGPAAEGEEVVGDLINVGTIPFTETQGHAYFNMVVYFSRITVGLLTFSVIEFVQ